MFDEAGSSTYIFIRLTKGPTQNFNIILYASASHGQYPVERLTIVTGAVQRSSGHFAGGTMGPVAYMNCLRHQIANGK